MDVLTVKHLPVKSERHPDGVQAKRVVAGVFEDMVYERISYGGAAPEERFKFMLNYYQ